MKLKYCIPVLLVLFLIGLSMPISAQQKMRPINKTSKSISEKKQDFVPNRLKNESPTKPAISPKPTDPSRTLSRASKAPRPILITPKPTITIQEKIDLLLKQIATVKGSNDPNKAAKLEKLEKVLKKRQQEKIFEHSNK